MLKDVLKKCKLVAFEPCDCCREAFYFYFREGNFFGAMVVYSREQAFALLAELRGIATNLTEAYYWELGIKIAVSTLPEFKPEQTVRRQLHRKHWKPTRLESLLRDFTVLNRDSATGA
jgi:hypothetical protein